MPRLTFDVLLGGVAFLVKYKGEDIDIVDLFIVLFVGAILLPIAISEFVGANTTGWGTTLVTVWDNIPIIGLVGVLVGMLYKYIRK